MAIFTGIAAAIGSAFTAVSGFIGGLGAIGSFVLKTAVGVGLNLLASALAGKPEKATFATNGKLQAGGDVPRSLLFGRTATAGSLVYANTWGRAGKTSNAYLTQVIALSDIPINGLTEFWVNGEKVTLPDMTGTPPYEMGWPITQYAKGSDNNLWIKFYDGTQTVADPFLVASVSSGERPYQSTRVGRGVAYVIVTSQAKEGMFTGFPTYKFAVNGARLYDPSRDSSVGGVGAQRRSTPSTWGGDGDHLPAVQIYNLLRGINYDGKWLYGVQGMSAARVPVAHAIAQINKCRATIQGASGPEPTYRTGGELPVDAPLGDAVEAILAGCQGRLSEAGGTYKLFLGAPDSPVASFDDGHILSTEEQSFTPFFGLADTINGIVASYPSPDEAWATKVAPPIYRTDLEAKAGNRRLMASPSLPFVPYAEQVQRLMKSALEEAQRARRHTLVLPPEYWVVEPGDIVAWTSERNGYIAKLFRVDGVADRANLDVMVDITEVDPSDYDWNTEFDFKQPVDGAVGIVRPTPQPIIDWYAEGAIIAGEGSRRRAGIRLSWDGDQIDVAAVQWEVRRRSDLMVVHQGRTDSVERGAAEISQNLFSLTQYGVRGRYIARSDRDTLWSDWLDVTTPDQPETDIAIELANLQKDLRDELARREVEFNELFERLEYLAANVGTGNIEDIVSSQRLTKEIGENKAEIVRESELRVGADEAFARDLTIVQTDVAGNTAAIISEATARSTADSALATSLGVVQTNVDDNTAAIIAESSARSTADSALAMDIAAVSAKTDAGTAQGLIGWTATSAPGGVSARFRLEGKATAGGTERFAGMYLDVLPTSSRVLFHTDNFIITDGSATGTPFQFTGSTLRLALANIGEVTAGIIRSPDSKMIINLTTGSLEWFD